MIYICLHTHARERERERERWSGRKRKRESEKGIERGGGIQYFSGIQTVTRAEMQYKL